MPSRMRGLSETLWVTACAAALGAILLQSPQPSSVPPALLPAVFGGTSQPPKPEPPKGPPPIPGWYAVATAPGLSDAQTIKLNPGFAAFALAQGQSIHPAIPAARMGVNYFGHLRIETPGAYRFALEAQGGTATLTIADAGGRKLGEIAGTPHADGRAAPGPWLSLQPGPVALTVRFTRTADGPARVRALWEKQGVGDKGFPMEPIPPASVSPPPFMRATTIAAETELRGRVLLGELNCVACHAPGEKGEAGIVRRRTPLLGEIGRRAAPDWLARYIADPQDTKPGCGMPDTIGDAAQDKQDAEAILHLLVSLGGPVPFEQAATEPFTVGFGRRLYHTVGCVACHGALESPTKVFGQDVPASAAMPTSTPPHPFGDLKAKWRPVALAEFLKDPLRTHPGGRMPSMSLKDEEADLLATYLANHFGQADPAQTAAFAVDPAKVERGRAAFSARGCASCHEIGHNQQEIPARSPARTMAQVRSGHGCLDPADTATPRYTLTDQDRADLAAGLQAIKRLNAGGTPAPAPIDHANLTMAALNCFACHSKNESGGLAEDTHIYCTTLVETDLGDEGRLPPHLTGVGRKLNAQWTRAVLTDAGRARPYMATRMPQYGEPHVAHLADGLAMMDGVVPGSDTPEPTHGDELILAGRRLVGDTGLSCLTCHSWSGKHLPNGPGPEITDFPERLRYEWWKSYIMAPDRSKPGTKMTSFYRDGKGTITDVLGGDPHRQADALWAYFTTGRFGPAPDGLPVTSGMPLKVAERPVVFRSFLKDAGSRGVAVGYPLGIHFSFDATGVRLVDAWRGDFLDATGAWKNRGGAISGGRGSTFWRAPKGPPLLIAPALPEKWPDKAGSDAGYRFTGYRLETDGTPVFQYRVANASVEEKFTPNNGSVIRAFTISDVPAGSRIYMRAGAGNCTAAADNAAVTDRGDATLHIFEIAPTDAAKPVSFTVTITPGGQS